MTPLVIVAMVFSFPHNYVSTLGSYPNVLACEASVLQTHVDPGNWIECHMLSGKSLKFKSAPTSK
jgi:hypothetical protein